ncbi:hypothetical protein VQ643_09455 [Pseudomonas sp. F1_0610]|uniref:hypothetical protein n=1 Tax=Pseudomonas sp. F1_0610 TaxID=3114284 RepID=UPI0039C31895
MAKPIIYTSEDTNGPGVALTGNIQNKLKQILKRCLVDGYPGKPAAGWKMIHEHPEGFSMTNGIGIINFASNQAGQSQTTAVVYLAETATDVSSAVIKGINLSSGQFKADFNSITTRHLLAFNGTLRTLKNVRWCVVADDKTAIFLINAADGYSQPVCSLYFGQFASDYFKDEAAFICAGGIINTINSATDNNLDAVSYLRNPKTGVVDQANPFLKIYPYSRRSQVVETKNLDYFSEETELSKALVHFDNGMCGRLRGLLYSDMLLGYGWKTSLLNLGVTNPQFNDILDFHNVGINIAFNRGYWGGCFVTDDEDYW